MDNGIEPAMGTPRNTADYAVERKPDSDHQAIRLHLRHCDFESCQWHDQEVVHGAVLAFAN
jgi:hypothetical protein